MKLRGSRVLVTGGAGFIGSHLVDDLIGEGCRVNVIDNLANGKLENLIQHENNPRFVFFRGDIRNTKIISKAMKGADIVFHLACLGVRHSIKNPLENHLVNAHGTLLVLKEARKAKIKRFLHCSSSEIYGTAKVVPMREDHPAYPCTVYGASKLAGEAYARAFYKTYGLPAVIVRPFNTYGPRSHHEGDAGELIPKSIVRMLSGEPILVFGNGLQTRDFTYVEDVARALKKAAVCDGAIGGTFNVGSNFEISIKDVAGLIAGRSAAVKHSRLKYMDQRPGDVMRLYADSTAFRKMTGWKPSVSFKEGLDRTIKWFELQGEAPAVLLKQEKGVNW